MSSIEYLNCRWAETASPYRCVIIQPPAECLRLDKSKQNAPDLPLNSLSMTLRAANRNPTGLIQL